MPAIPQPEDESVKDPDALLRGFERLGYIADHSLATAVYLILKLRKPLLIEGHAGLGKTEAAKALASMLGTQLIRLQCYEGLDVSSSVYEWNYQKQLLAIKIQEGTEQTVEEKEKHIFSREFLLERLSDFQISVPEMGTIQAIHIPYVILTSNRTRELSDALKRRCLYHWIDYPSFEKEMRIVRARLSGIEEDLGAQVVRFIQAVRQLDLAKPPGVAETLDCAQAVAALGSRRLDAEVIEETMGCVAKSMEDAARLRAAGIDKLLPQAF